MTVLRFGATIFVSATLLFACQPLIARMVVPLLGGAPAVWIVCSLCFQTLLLAGYGYAHLVGTRLPLKAQVALQLVLVASVFLVMPIAIDEAMVQRLLAGSPTLGLLLLLLRTIGLPFFVLSTTSPLIQRWFSELGEKDPYHLYAAANAGSMLALLGYPLLVEPVLPVRAQSRALHVGFALFTLLIVVCAATTLRRRDTVRVDATPAPPQVRVPESVRLLPPEAPSTAELWVERLGWLGLAFAPSSLLLGATEYVTADVASVPLLWVLPLALYLASFIVAFAKREVIRPTILSRTLAAVALLVATLFLTRIAKPAWFVLGAHLLLLFVASVVCHRALALRRPHVARLTEFYFLMSLGGVLGGAFNGLLAPFVFKDLFEYPIAIGLVCFGRAALERQPGTSLPPSFHRGAMLRDLPYGVGLGVVTFAIIKLAGDRNIVWIFGPPLLVALLWARRPFRYAIAIGSVLLAGMAHGGESGPTLFAQRSFFGSLKVTREREGRFQLLVIGRSMHGKQALDPEKAPVPLAYYHPLGPAGDVLGPLPSTDPLALHRDRPAQKVGVIGLGIGSLAAYARPGDEWTFFEINPAIVEIARHHFSFVEKASALSRVSIEIGDARLRLKHGDKERFDILVLDAFTSDAVPIHLVTREALGVYRRALRPGGVLLAHITNDHIRLQPVFAALAREAGMTIIERHDVSSKVEGKDASEWVLLSDSREFIVRVRSRNPEWKPLEAPPSQSVWTDDYANVLAVMRF